MAKTAHKEDTANGKLTPAEQKRRIEAAEEVKQIKKAAFEASRIALCEAQQAAQDRYTKTPTKKNYRDYVAAVNRAPL